MKIIIQNIYFLKKINYFILKSNFSSLSSIFNKIHLKNNYVDYANSKKCLFNIEHLNCPQGFFKIEDIALKRCDELEKEALSINRKRKMVEIFDELSNTLCNVADLCEFVKNCHPYIPITLAAEDVSTKINFKVEELNTNQQLYLALKNVVENGDVVQTSSEDNYVANLFLIDMEQSGIYLNKENRELILTLHKDILHYGISFLEESSKPSSINSDIQGESIKLLKKVNLPENYVLNSSYIDSDKEVVREFVYKSYLSYHNKTDIYLTKLLQARHKMSILCGFDSYVQRTLRNSIAKNPEFVLEFLVKLSNKVKPFASKNYEILFDLKKKLYKTNNKLQIWDVQYLINMYKKRYFSSDISSISLYFSIGNCMEGLNIIYSKLFDIEFIPTETFHGEVWFDDIVKLNVVNKITGQTLGLIYLDIFGRERKPNQDCHFTIRGGCELPNGNYQNPIVVLSLNFFKYEINEPCFLSPNMIDNLFHEMGHAVHSMLARTKYQHITGTRCSTDLAEIPSILMEQFSSDKRVLQIFAKHFETNQTISTRELDQLINFKKLFLPCETELQVFYSILDQLYHGKNPLKNSTTDTLKKCHQEYFGLEYINDTSYQLRFSHLFGYGGKYYSYLMSKAIVKLIWNKLFKENPLNKNSGKLLKDKLLKHGGGKPPNNLVEDLLEMKLDSDILSDSIIEDFK